MYEPKTLLMTPGAKQETQELGRYLFTELRAIANALQARVDLIEMNTLHKEPILPRSNETTVVVQADGTDWNPGAGAGLYAYESGAWVKLS